MNKNRSENDYSDLIHFSEILFRTVSPHLDLLEFEKLFINGFFKAPPVVWDFYFYHFLNLNKKSDNEDIKWISKETINEKLEISYLDDLISFKHLRYPVLITGFLCLEKPKLHIKQRTITRIFEFDDYDFCINKHSGIENTVSNRFNYLQINYKSSIEILQEIFKLEKSELNDYDWLVRFGSHLRLLFEKKINPNIIIEILLPNFTLLRSKYKTLSELELFLSMEVLVPKEDKFFTKLIEALKDSNLYNVT